MQLSFETGLKEVPLRFSFVQGYVRGLSMREVTIAGSGKSVIAFETQFNDC